MKSKLIISLTCASVLLASGCASLNPNSNTYFLNRQAVNGPVAKAQSDGEILGALVVLNKNEIAAAQAARKKSSNPAVRSYAAHLSKEHTANLHQAKHLAKKLGITLHQGDVAQMLQREGNQVSAELKPLHGSAFDKAYINDMVKGHSQALSIVDQLLNQTSNLEVKSYLNATRAHIVDHLQRAQQLQRQLNQ